MNNSYCQGESILNFQQLWNSSLPIFNRCFQHTIPVWIPFGLLWLMVPWQACHLLRARPIRSIPCNAYNASRLLLVLTIIAANGVQFGFDLQRYLNPKESLGPSLADVTFSLVNVCSFVLLAFLLHLHRLYGIHTSGVAWLFTLLSTLLSLPTVYMFIAFGRHQHGYSSQLELITYAIYFVSIGILFVLTCFADARPVRRTNQTTRSEDSDEARRPLLDVSSSVSNIDTDEEETEDNPLGKECPNQRASILSLLTFWWVNGLTLTGYRKSLTLSDLWRLNPEDSTKRISFEFDKNWSKSKSQTLAVKYGTFESTEQNYAHDQTAQQKTPPGIGLTLARTFKYELLASALSELFLSSVIFVNPQLLKVFLGFMSSDSATDPQWHGYVLSGLLFVFAEFMSFGRTYVAYVVSATYARVRTALISAIYRKSLTLSNASRSATTTGEIVNLMSTDVEHISWTFTGLNMAWAAPYVLVLAMYFLWLELGVAVFAGFAILVLVIPINAWITRAQGRYQDKQMKEKDERVKVISEVLGGIRVIKLYGWELPFIGKITDIRQREVRQIRNVAYTKVASSITWTLAPFLVSLVSFGTYVLISSENVLTPQKAFVSLALFETLRFPMTEIPDLISHLVMAYISLKRINRFLNSGQVEKYATRHESSDAVSIENGTFAWSVPKCEGSADLVDDPNESSSKTILNEINLQVPNGSLVAVVGQVGSGKSSLLSAILGDMEQVEGRVNIAPNETVAYIAQQAWIQNATLRDNILFGLPYDQRKYDKIIEACALAPDLAILPGGDQTEIGEKGINLSGGQKQRVAIARACYSSASLVLLDDPLSAVDSHVAKHIFAKVLSNKTGLLRHKTRLLVTNSISILPEVDCIVVLESGRIRETGTYRQLAGNSGKFADFLQEYSIGKSVQRQESEEPKVFSRSISRQDSKDTPHTPTTPLEQPDFDNGQLIEEELAETGRVKASVYWVYFKSWTLPCAIITFAAFLATQGATLWSDIWLTLWSNDGLAQNGSAQADVALRNYRLSGYGLISLLQSALFTIGVFCLATSNVNSSKALHRSLLEQIMRSPMSFFDTTPVGRIVNRFSKDIDTVDSIIPQTFQAWYTQILYLLFSIVMVAVKMPIFILVVLPVSLLYIFIQKFYIATYRQLKRLESIHKSPVFSHFSETLSGISTIRAFGHSQRFVTESNRRVDTMQRCLYPSWNCNRWLELRLEFTGNLLVLAVALFATIYRDSFRLEPGFVGLLITYSLGITDALNLIVRRTSGMENNMVPVERINEYCHNVTEREWTRSQNQNPQIPNGWPMKGEIEFFNYSVRYRKGLDLVLKKLNVKINAGDKVGVVGRTGAGKSSLTLALFRILEADQGHIFIDGIPIEDIGLHELRDKLSIIPQDPVLFSGTIRTNLDPFGYYTDELLWRALEHSHLKEYIACQDQGLDHPVAENGGNLSVGQRQLICLARALLRKTKILVLDEATAAVDLETDSLIQQTIRQEFAHCTVITIAHRLNTIMDSSKVLVMEQGKVAEFDSPQRLLTNSKSMFYGLAKDANLV